MNRIVPQPFLDVEMCRHLGKSFPPDGVPQSLRKVPIGSFEVRVRGRWYRCAGSYMAADGPMVWIEAETVTTQVVAVKCGRCGGHGQLDPAGPGCAPSRCPGCAGTGEEAWELYRGDHLLGWLIHPHFERACAEGLARKIERLNDEDAETAIEHFAEHGTLPSKAAM